MKEYTTPYVEKITFDYTEQIATASGKCTGMYLNEYTGQNCTSESGDIVWNDAH